MTALVDKNKLKIFLNIHEDDDRYDELFEHLALATTPLVENYLDRSLTSEAVVEYHESSSDELNHVWVKRYPINDSPTIQVEYSGNYAWATPEDISSKIFVEPDIGLIRVFSDTDADYTNTPIGFRVTYTGGYTEEGGRWPYLNVPDAISTAAALQIAYFFEMHNKGSMGLTNSSGDPQNTPKVQTKKGDKLVAMIPEARTLLRPFVRRADLAGKEF